LRSSSEQLDTGNADAIVMHAKGKQEIQLRWDSNSVLSIQCIQCKPEDVFSRVRNWKRISIVYTLDGNSDPVKPIRQD